jgi:ABC-type transporter Mla subunit MlaD
MNHNKMKLAVGLFTISLFLLLFASVFFLLKAKGTFEKRYTYHCNAYSAENFSVGMPLKFSGFNIGAIDKIALNDDGSVFITFSVNKSNQKWISQGSVLMSTRPLIGQAYIELYTSLGTPPLKKGASLELLSTDNINDLIQSLNPVVKKAINVLDNVNNITSDMAKKDSDFRQILHNLNQFSKKLAQDDSLLTSFTGDKKTTLSIISSLKKTVKIMKDVEKITHDISDITASLNKTIVNPTSSSLKDLDMILKDVKEKLNVINEKELIEIKEQISVGLTKSNQIINKVDTILSDTKSEKVELP